MVAPKIRRQAGEEPQTLDAAWVRLRRHLERADNFWLGAVFTAYLDVARDLRERAEFNCRIRSAPFVCLSPGTPSGLAGLLDRVEAEGAPAGGCTWVEALQSSLDRAEATAWHDAWAILLQALNHRRDSLRSRLGGLVLIAPPPVKQIAMRVSTDLWSVLAYLAEVAPAGRPESRDLTHETRGVPSSPTRRSVVAWDEGLGDEVSREVSALMEAADPALLEPPLSARLDARVTWALEKGWPATAAALLTRRAEALASMGDLGAATREYARVASIYRGLAETNPAAYLPDLAMSLNNLGNRLSEVGQREEALTPTTEAVQIYRRLAEANPAAYLPDLAMSLNNLGLSLSEVGQREEALTPTSEAVQIYRRLAEANPAAYLPGLANSLWTVGWLCAAHGVRLVEGLAAVQEAIAILEPLAARLPAAFAGRLNGMRTTMAELLDGLGRTEDAAQVRRQVS